MDMMKKFGQCIIALILLALFTTFIARVRLQNSYRKIKDYEINVTGIYVGVDEAKATSINGYIKGVVKNNSDNVIENKYLKFTMLSKNGRIMGEKYVRIDRLERYELRNYEVQFEYDQIKSFRVELVDTMPEGVSFFELIKENVKDYSNKIFK